MAEVRGSHFPDELLYDVDNHIWYRELPDGSVRLGMTRVATALLAALYTVYCAKAPRAGARRAAAARS
ncbi:MAG: hypothetical protein EHM59_03280 [Betaproteobacteria bacterium]|nr:MAG: hypothetical protein EHM59_03280 [Betaproteobacteria bacterium]